MSGLSQNLIVITDERGFYITLSSAGAAGAVDADKLGTTNFQIREQLLDPIDTTAGRPSLEVGLVRFSYPRSWYTIEDQIQFQLNLGLSYFDYESSALGFPVQQMNIRCTISIEPPNTHIDLDRDILLHINSVVAVQLGKAIRNELRNHPRSHLLVDSWVGGGDFFKVEYDDKLGHATISDPTFHRRADGAATTMGAFKGLNLWKILGFTQFSESTSRSEIGFSSLPVHAQKHAILASTNPMIRIYAPNLIYHQRVGDTFKPLLDMIPVIAVGGTTVTEKNSGEKIFIKQSREIVTYEQEHPLYKRVRPGYINELVIDIRDNNDIDIPHISGSATLILHIRPCRQK